MKLDHNRLDIVCVDQQNKNCLITDIACLCDKRVDIEQEINNKYSQKLPLFFWSTGYYSEDLEV